MWLKKGILLNRKDVHICLKIGTKYFPRLEIKSRLYEIQIPLPDFRKKKIVPNAIDLSKMPNFSPPHAVSKQKAKINEHVSIFGAIFSRATKNKQRKTGAIASTSFGSENRRIQGVSNLSNHVGKVDTMRKRWESNAQFGRENLYFPPKINPAAVDCRLRLQLIAKGVNQWNLSACVREIEDAQR